MLTECRIMAVKPAISCKNTNVYDSALGPFTILRPAQEYFSYMEISVERRIQIWGYFEREVAIQVLKLTFSTKEKGMGLKVQVKIWHNDLFHEKG
jgi:hypothetical protein